MLIKVIIPSTRRFFLRLAGKRLLQHLMFWTASYLFLVNFFASSDSVLKIDYIYTALFHVSLLAAVYLNIWLLIPRLLQKGRYLAWLIALPALIYASALLNLATFNFLVDMILPEYFFISYYEIADILKFIFVYVALTSLLKLSKGWFLLMQTEQQLMAIRQEKVETELKALKSQINPHFLFNSLNNIYSLSLGGSKSTPPAILKLSELMRYMLYESNEERVALTEEIRFMDNYIELQKLRSDQRSRIEYRKQGDYTGKNIAPLLFLPFIENGFKHGIKGDPAGGYVIIEFAIHNNNVDLYVENNKGHVDEVEKNDFNGIGLNNVKRRLELMYPGKYELEILDQEDKFSVRVKLDLL
jgi:sensor histidine kinase YesM